MPAPPPPAAEIGEYAIGWLVRCIECSGVVASGSCSQEKREPKWKCCTTGNFERTSAFNILIIPYDLVSQLPRS